MATNMHIVSDGESHPELLKAMMHVCMHLAGTAGNMQTWAEPPAGSLAFMSELATTMWGRMCDTMESLAANSSIVGGLQICYDAEQSMDLKRLLLVTASEGVLSHPPRLFPTLVLDLKVRCD